MAKKILIVDDDLEDLNTMKSILEKENYSVDIASEGATAIDVIEGDDYDLILIDIRMPTLSGYDLLRLMRERLDGKIPMVYVTVVPKDEVDVKGIDGIIQKPFSPESFLKEVKKVLK